MLGFNLLSFLSYKNYRAIKIKLFTIDYKKYFLAFFIIYD
ncbi:hypothetical protein HPSA_03350 [Helicobacter pylori SouthAfrica7]|uniref:Uncharacterized protein n=1 Tax=Helicobacter pylori (strain SouthAfrica7) TaxID=907239 RepID=E8QW48_HELPW|nr:hypothetical protein HPSA_03350 [Helicobacter pylori SouthAfrica7]